ncbi:hypothetical protein WK22_17625 [Burkholderia multivorans]|nr:hypothetical protein WK22_17625 [Burkholderia multivorans]
MTDAVESNTIRPIVGDASLIARLREIHHTPWPADLFRFAPFTLSGDDKDSGYVAIAWMPATRKLYAQRIIIGAPPPASRMPQPMDVDADGWLSRVGRASSAFRPEYMKLSAAEVPSSSLAGLSKRVMLINALLMVDPMGMGRESDYIFNDFVFCDAQRRNERIKEIGIAVNGGPGFHAYLIKLLTKFMWYGGGQQALLARTPDRGGPKRPRLKPAIKPGPLSALEKLDKARAIARGRTYVRTAMRIDSTIRDTMTKAATHDWAVNKRTLADTYRLMIGREYSNCRIAATPSYGALYYHLSKYIEPAHNLQEKRYGHKAAAQYVAPRAGSSSDLTQGAIEILDADGFIPKIPIGGLVKGKLEPVEVCVVLAVSRLSGGIWGYEILLERERSEGYLRCLVWSLLPMDDRVKALGLPPLPGLLHGNFDGLFVDNGPGKKKTVRVSAVDTLGGTMFNPPGGRGDLKSMGERMNKTIIRLMADETDVGYTRDSDVLEKLKREERARRKPLTIDDFERLLLKSINYLNLTSNKAHLRTNEMANAGVGIVPAEIHRYYQRLRRGRADRSWTPEEVFDTFLPWKEVTCVRGRVKYEGAQYTSPELIEIAANHAQLPIKRKLKVEIKRTVQDSWTLLCRVPENIVFEIEMTDEDKRRFGSGGWKKLELANRDEALQEKAHLEPQRARSAGKIRATQQEQVDSYERGRGNIYAGAIGVTRTQAKRNGRASRANEFANIERAIYLPSSDKQPPLANEPQRDAADDIDDPLAAAAQRVEEAYLRKK